MYTWGSYNIAKVMHMQQSAIDGVENIHSSSKGSRYCSNGGKNEPIRYILFAFVVKSCNQEMYFIQQSNNNHYFLCTLQNTDIDIAMRWYNPAIYVDVYYQQSKS
jgi:hypothetical protein